MTARAHHLQEERLFDCYLADRGGEPIDPPAAEHLADCAECGKRYGDLARFMDSLWSEADAETDAIFTPERLRAQQQQLLRRLEHVGRAARVISFPGRFVSRHMTARASRVVPRWVAATAAAGLFLGVGAGLFYDGDTRAARLASVRHANASRPARLAPVATRGSVAPPSTDADADQFLSELELALDRPRTPELLPFDALTPHVREISNPLR